MAVKEESKELHKELSDLMNRYSIDTEMNMLDEDDYISLSGY